MPYLSYIKERWQLLLRQMPTAGLIILGANLFSKGGETEYESPEQIAELLTIEFARRGMRFEKIPGPFPDHANYFDRHLSDGYKHNWHPERDDTEKTIETIDELIDTIKKNKN